MGFLLTSGVRQGCPLSPLIFVLSVDILLRTLERIEGITTRAFADDIGMVMDNFSLNYLVVFDIFQRFAKVSNLYLNLPKTVIIPLWPKGIKETKYKLQSQSEHSMEHRRLLLTVDIASHGRYLGFMEGPGKRDHSWDKPLIKYDKVSRIWAKERAGLHMSIKAHNVYAISVLSFVGQLENPSDPTIKTSKSLIPIMASGPGNWISHQDLIYAKDSYGQASQLRSIKHMCQASHIRVAFTDITDYKYMHTQIQEWRRTTEQLSHLAYYHTWYNQAHCTTLNSTVDNCSSLLSLSSLLELAHSRFAKSEDPPLTAASPQFRSHCQALAYEILLKKDTPNFNNRIRYKMHRWQLNVPPHRLADKIHRRLLQLRRLVSPRVLTSVWKLLWNGWITGRRFQNRSTTFCLFRCSDTAEDSIEHYVRCPIIREFARRKLNLHDLFPEHFFLAVDHLSIDDLTCIALLTYSVFTSLIALANNADAMPREEYVQLLCTRLKFAVEGHSKSSKVLLTRFGPPA
jgi:hypothetical protein